MKIVSFFGILQRNTFMGWYSRLLTSNNPPRDSSNPWGPKNDVLDDVAVLLNEMGKALL